MSRALIYIILCAAGLFASARAEEARETSRLIDARLGSSPLRMSFAPAPRAEQTDLVRRVYLDILGRIPTAAETEAYLADPADDKHQQLVETLLTHDEMPVFWALVLDEWLCGTALERDFGRDGFLTYLEEALRTNRPWNQIARELLVPDVTDPRQRGAAYFLALCLRAGDATERIDNLTSAVATGLFGIQLQCAKCHDHPFVPDLKQDHYYGLAAFLGRLQDARFQDVPLVKERAEGEVQFVTTAQERKTAALMFLDGRTFTEPPRPEDRQQWYAPSGEGLPETPYFSRRTILADYALTAESPYFKRAIVNRIWKQLLGRGLVEPVDQMHAENPASHPELLDELADDFASHGFNLRRLLAALLHSDAYLRSSRWTMEGPRPPETSYAVSLLRPLSPEQLTLSISLATGDYDQFATKLEREKQNRKLDAITPALTRRLFARDRDVQEFASRFRSPGGGFDTSAAQALFLTYHPLMTRQLQPGRGNLTERLARESDPAVCGRIAWLHILSRPPTDQEQRRVAEYLAAPQPSRGELCRELVWALLCSAESRFNH